MSCDIFMEHENKAAKEDMRSAKGEVKVRKLPIKLLFTFR